MRPDCPSIVSDMKPSIAFEVTAEDVRLLMRNRNTPVSIEQAQELFEKYVSPHAGRGGRIERAALQADDIDEQTESAHDDIVCILMAAGVLPPISAS